MNVVALLQMVSSAQPDGVAVAPDTTYSRLFDHAAAGAAELIEGGAAKVAYLASNGLALPTALFASAWAGVPFIPLNYRLSDPQLSAILDRNAGTWLIAEDPQRLRDSPSIDRVMGVDEWLEIVTTSTARPEWSDDDGAAVLHLYTSGTTGEPKGVVLRHRHLVSYVLSNVEFLSSGNDEAMLVSVPPYHIAGIANLISNLFSGRRLVYLDRFSESAWMDTVQREGITHAMVVPTMLTRLVRELEERQAIAPASLRLVSYGGAKAPASMLQRALERFPATDFVNAYGLTETSSTIALLGPEDHRAARSGDPLSLRRLESVGKVLDSVQIRIASAEGTRLPTGQIGHVAVRGDQVSGEYLESGSATDSDGWYETRDLGWLDEDGYLYLQGRADDTIIRGGENIAPAEIEGVLREHPFIDDVVVVGVPDEEWGERVVAVVVGTALDPAELRQWSLNRLRTSKAPDHFVVRVELPYSETGKLLRRAVRALVVPNA